jgi:protoporphyrin/coproporphyrin ferrochelatase
VTQAIPSTTCHFPNEYAQTSTKKVGALIVNLGTPDAPDFWSIRRYLKEFLSDRRVVDVPVLLWKVILNLLILTFRPSKVAKLYKSIWRQDTNESPLRYYTREQGEKLAAAYEDVPNFQVAWAMRYGNPSIESQIKKLQADGCQRLVVVPLYPQYSATTTASVNDQVFRCLMKMRWQPTVRIADPYHDHPSYIDALANSITRHLRSLDWQPEKILASFHGLPKAYFQKGDPYSCFCQKTVRLLQQALQEGVPPVEITFQSRMGPREWLRPYTDETIQKLAQDGIKRLAVITPGFASDCLETLEEIQIRGRDLFLENGGIHFTQIPCLNDGPDAIKLLKDIVDQTSLRWNE